MFLAGTAFVAAVVALSAATTSGFLVGGVYHARAAKFPEATRPETSLCGGGMFGFDLPNFGDFGFGKKSSPDEDYGDGDGDGDGIERIMTLQGKSMKFGGFRLLISLFLMGEQGTPHRGSWRTDQADDGSLTMAYLRDGTGALTIRLDSESAALSIHRLGERPSATYSADEGDLLHGLLDEIRSVAEDGDAEDSDRLFALGGDQIEAARGALPPRGMLR
mmetsp:Transcript_49866/g.97572  ORF Transcript_49866/g.97572 Transcript_49866/m.97572 type:complete len:219 (-) Transcript_49866:437-1093(-)|eukprot:CAMPEP_0194311898 /NCGR_PEP_ID=MMETSP0171-20130528/8827_1 /TAXON_ID=218684 /ORGANISM="Corethron pennatum, Strain L29A3" /LENGTH=218 /DNA_ID=CAMNT_0039066183 /DNA_START=174 /DNA_END=830 /DNA_ORIENTATION=+